MEEQRQQAAAAQAKAVANKADEQHWQDALAAEQRRQESAERAAATAERALAVEQRRQELAKRAAAMAEKALAAEQCHRESAERAAERAEKALAAKHCCRELAKPAAALADSVLAAEQRHQELAERAAALAESALAKEQRCRELAECAAAMAKLVSAKEQRCQELAERPAVLAERTLANKHRCREAAECSETLAETVLAKEQPRSSLAEAALAEYNSQTKASRDATVVEVAKHAMTLVVTVLDELKATPKLRYSGPPPTHFSPPLTATEVAELDAAIRDKRRRHKTATREKALAKDANKQHCNKVNRQHCHDSATWEKALDDDACEQLCRESSKRTATLATLALAAMQTVVLADLALPKPALAEDKQRQEETAKKQCHADNEHVMAPVLPPNPSNAAIRRIWVECALLVAPLNAILAKIECNNMVHEARAPLTTTLPHPAAMLSTPPRPMTYVGAGLSTMGGSTRVTSLALAPSAIPSPIVNGQLRTVRQCAQPCRCTGRRHRPRAPSPPDKVLPSQPHPTKEGLSTPTNPPNLLARATTRSGMPSLAPPLTASSTPSLLPFTFGSEVCLSSEGVVAHPFCVGNPPPQKHT
jgi:hypothetical protein